MDKHTQEQRRKNMQAVKNKDSQIELILRAELWKRGLRYQKNRTDVFGKPDVVFKGKKIAVFCDSEFWHGYNWEERKLDIKSRREFWIPKIERNMQRDIEVTRAFVYNITLGITSQKISSHNACMIAHKCVVCAEQHVAELHRLLGFDSSKC